MCKRYLVLLLAIGSVAAPSVFAAGNFELPLDLQSLLPEQIAAVVAISSTNEFADQYEELLTAMNEDEEISREDVFELFDHVADNFTTYVNLDRPLVMAVGLPDMMGGGDPPFTIILPVREGIEEVAELSEDDEFAKSVFEGEYLALSTDPAYTPSQITPSLVEHLPAGVLSGTLDLESVILNFRPFVEMGLAGIPTRPEGAPTDSIPGFSIEEATALAETVRKVMDSATRLDLSLDRDRDLVTWHTGLGVKPGSALDPGPQPDFERALALTAALPEDQDFLQVLALDQTRMFTHFQDYYLIMMKNSLGGMSDDQADRYGAWVEKFIASMELWAQPMAAALHMEENSMAVVAVMESDDAEAAVAELSEILTGMNELGIGYALTRRDDEKVAGADFHVWDVDIDLAQFEAVMPHHEGPAMTGTARMQAEQVVSILRKVMPRIYVGNKDGRVFMASDGDPEALARTVKRAGKRSQPVHAVADIAAKAGPGCQQIVTGDLLAILNWVTELMEELDEEQRVVFAGNPIPFQAAVTIDGQDFGFDMGMDLPALSALIQAVEEMEERERSERRATEPTPEGLPQTAPETRSKIDDDS